MRGRRTYTAILTLVALCGAQLAMGVAAVPAGAVEPAFVTFAAAVDLSVLGSVAVADIDDDGVPDLISSGVGFPPSVSVSLGTGGGGFAAPITSSSGGAGLGFPTLVDLNGDTFLDLVTPDVIGNKVSVMLGDGAGHFGAATQFASGGTNPGSLSVGDLDGDLLVDLAVTNTNSNSLSVLLGKGDGTFAAAVVHGLASRPGAVVASDLNGDASLDLVVNILLSRAVVLLGDGDGTFGPPTAINFDGESSLVVTDLSGDSVPDLAGTRSGQGIVTVSRGNGDGTFSGPFAYSTPNCGCSVTAGDLNGDGSPDLVVSRVGSPGGISVLVGRGDGTFVPHTDFEDELRPGIATVADLNGDTLLDLAVPHNDGLVLLMNRPGLPQPPTARTAVGGHTSARVSWSPPASAGASPITGYVVTPYPYNSFEGPLPSTTFNSTATRQTITGLTNGSRYIFRVAAINALGVGQRSQSWTNSVLVGVQAPPTIGIATAGNAQTTVTWTAPAPNGSPPVTGYRVTAFVGYFPVAARTFASTATTQTFTGLTNGTTYRFKVAAINSIGVGSESVASNPATPAPTVPGAPVIGTATPGDGQATVSWTPPASNGGSAITGYVVIPYIGYYPLTPTNFSPSSTTGTVTGLANGTTYRFRVRATNTAGTGGYSKVSNAVTPTP